MGLQLLALALYGLAVVDMLLDTRTPTRAIVVYPGGQGDRAGRHAAGRSKRSQKFMQGAIIEEVLDRLEEDRRDALHEGINSAAELGLTSAPGAARPGPWPNTGRPRRAQDGGQAAGEGRGARPRQRAGARRPRADALGPRKDVIIRMPEAEATQLKAAAALERMTVQDFVLQALRPALELALRKRRMPETLVISPSGGDDVARQRMSLLDRDEAPEICARIKAPRHPRARTGCSIAT